MPSESLVHNVNLYRGKIENVMCGNMITVLWGKTAGSIYMAGCIDNIRKECNMTPKQWYDMGESVIQVPGCE